MYNRAKECMKSTAVAAGRYSGMAGGTGGELPPQNIRRGA